MNTERICKKILRLTGDVIVDFSMIRPGDHILVGLSGGKDSWTLLQVLSHLRRHAPIRFEISACKVDYPESSVDNQRVREACENLHIPFHLIESSMERIIRDHARPGRSTCPFCARLRRGMLYTRAKQTGAGVVALGHHREDANQTLLMNMLFNGRMKGMPPVLRTDDGRLRLIRPLIRVPEALIQQHIARSGLPLVHHKCPYAEDNQRVWTAELIQKIEEDIPQASASILAAQTRITPSHLMDSDLWDFSVPEKENS